MMQNVIETGLGKFSKEKFNAQLQLEALVIRLKRGVFTVNNSFREENYDDPVANGRRLSEFTVPNLRVILSALADRFNLKLRESDGRLAVYDPVLS